MNKNELIDAVAAETGLDRSDAAKATEALLNGVVDALSKGDQVA
ncbi:MAG: HU family DNA-binding protein, partial [Gammaproteobacteria bacterium]|nr:HU family DNA-binding protein [Gammaproteobacteria bacterium]